MHGFKPLQSAGPDMLQAVMSEYRDTANMVIIDDTTDSNTFGNGTSWFDRNVYTVSIIASYDLDDMQDLKTKKDLCRAIFRQFISKILRDKRDHKFGDALTFLNTKRIYSKEYGRYSFHGATGLFFMIENDEAFDLVYRDDEWEE